MKIFIGGAWHDIPRRMVFIGGAWRRVTRRMIYIDGAWEIAARFIDPISVSVPPETSNYTASNFSSPVTVYVSATPSGGLPPYTYSWTANPDIGPTPTLSGASTANVTATVSVPPDGVYSASIVCTVSDSIGSTPAIGTCLATFINSGI